MDGKVVRLGIQRDPAFSYFVKGGAVFRVHAKKEPGEVAERIADLGVAQEPGWVYFLDPEGDVARKPLASRTAAPASAPAVPFAAAFAPLRAHVGRAVSLRLPAKVGGLKKGRHALTVLDWSALDEGARAVLVESHLLELAAALGRGWADRCVPVGLIGGESRPVPVGELDQQLDGVLLVDLSTGAVVLCPDATSSRTVPVASSTDALDLVG